MDALVYKAADLDNATLARLGSEGYAIFDPATKGDLLLFVKDTPTAPPPPTVPTAGDAAPLPSDVPASVEPVAAPTEAMPTEAMPTDAGGVTVAFPTDAYAPPADQPAV